MAARHAPGEPFWGYSLGPADVLSSPCWTRRDSSDRTPYSKSNSTTASDIPPPPITYSCGATGAWPQRSELRPNDALMPLYRDLARGYEMVYQPIDGYLYPTHRLADGWNLRHEIYADAPATHRHHIGYDRRNNRPTNTQRMPASEHITPAYRNHKVAAVREIPGDHDVYCLTVPEAGNFALESGVFVKNCGIIVNVTPLEPEWEGHVTLEFSNTTPLPAKIYANEGVAQMLFLQSMRSARRPTAIAVENTKVSAASPCRKLEAHSLRHSARLASRRRVQAFSSRVRLLMRMANSSLPLLVRSA